MIRFSEPLVVVVVVYLMCYRDLQCDLIFLIDGNGMALRVRFDTADGVVAKA